MNIWRAFYHLIWTTQEREPWIDDERAELIRASVIQTAGEHDTIVHAVGCMPDHVHVLTMISPEFAVEAFIERLKRDALLKMESTSRPEFRSISWDSEYGGITISERSLIDVKRYVENQPDRHLRNRLWPDFERTREVELN
jgi:putative transposase